MACGARSVPSSRFYRRGRRSPAEAQRPVGAAAGIRAQASSSRLVSLSIRYLSSSRVHPEGGDEAPPAPVDALCPASTEDRGAGARGRAGRLSPGLALYGEGWTWGRLPSDAFPGPRAPCSNPRRPLSPAIWSAPGCPACVSSLAGDTALRAIKPCSDLLSLNPLLLADFQTDYLLSH